jgi:hypothetical protein
MMRDTSMALKLGDVGELVKTLQRGLNKLGSLLLVDGEYGPGTQAAVVDACTFLKRPGPPVADDALIDTLHAFPDSSRELTAAGATFLGREEISSPMEYRRRHKCPAWPSTTSGITIGIGYDLRFASETSLNADWGDVLPEATLARLAQVIGVVGSADRLALVAGIEIPLPATMTVFLQHMVPQHAARTRIAYPSLDRLAAHQRTALVSLVFNRGSAVEGPRRREMKVIQKLLAAGRLAEVPAQFEAMTRLWDPAKERGPIERRRREATLWRNGFSALRLQ